MAAYPQIQTYVALYLVVCPLYCNTLLANLNGRSYIRGDNYTEPISLMGASQGRIAFTSFPSAGPAVCCYSLCVVAAVLTPSQHSQETTNMTLRDLPLPSFSNNSSLKLDKPIKHDEV